MQTPCLTTFFGSAPTLPNSQLLIDTSSEFHLVSQLTLSGTTWLANKSSWKGTISGSVSFLISENLLSGAATKFKCCTARIHYEEILLHSLNIKGFWQWHQCSSAAEKMGRICASTFRIPLYKVVVYLPFLPTVEGAHQGCDGYCLCEILLLPCELGKKFLLQHPELPSSHSVLGSSIGLRIWANGFKMHHFDFEF